LSEISALENKYILFPISSALNISEVTLNQTNVKLRLCT